MNVQATVPDLCRIQSGSRGGAALRCTSGRAYQISTVSLAPAQGARGLSQTREGEVLVVTVIY